LAGIITTVGQFLKLNELTESHRAASVAWDKFHRSIRIELIKAPEERPDVNYFMKTSRDEFDRLMETCPGIDKNILEMFKKQLTTGIDKHDVIRKNKNFNRLIKPEIFNEINTLKDSVFKRPDNIIEIDMAEKIKYEKIINEKEEYTEKTAKVSNFISTFQNKYSRRPSEEEIISNLKNVMSVADIKIITSDLTTP
jgi:hypothetical protein